MAIVLLEGFDHYLLAFGDPDQKSMKGWNGGTALTGVGRLPYGAQSHCAEVILNNGISKTLPTSYSEVFFGLGFKVQTLGGVPFVDLSSNARIGLNNSRIAIFDKTGTLVATGTNILVQDNWYYVEGHFTSTHGEVRLNGLSEIASTAGSFSGGFSSIGFEYQVLGTPTLYIDDLYICDTSGGINTSFLGDICVETLYPISDGTYTQWTPDTGSSHYQRVDELIMDENASYVHTTGAGNKDSYGIGNPTLANTTVYGVQLNLGAKKNDSGTRTIDPLIRQSGVDYLGTTRSLIGNYQFYSQIYNQDPSGSNWTYTTVNNNEYGIELVS